jgi:hypothetical protein
LNPTTVGSSLTNSGELNHQRLDYENSRNILVTELSCLSHERMKPESVRAIGEPWFGNCTLPWVILGVFTVFWFSFFALVSPQPGGPDVFVFRDAGCNWAHGRGLVAASVPTANTTTPLLFASYTPGALLLFGLAASLFGCSGSVDTFYNLALAAAAVFLLYRCFSLAVTSGWQRACAALLLGAVLPTGMVAFDSDRPEMPAFCLLAAILLLWRRTSSVATRSLIFACNGLVFLLHPFAGIAGWLLLAFLLLFDERGVEAHSRTGRLQVVVAGSALYALIVAVWALSMWSQDHTSLHRFLEHAAGRGTGAGVVLHGAKASAESGSGTHNGYAVAFRQLFNPAFPTSAAMAISLLVSGVVVAAYAFRGPERPRLLLQCALLLSVLLIFPLAVFPAQANYLGLSRALLLAVLFIGGFPLASAVRGTMAPLSLILVAFVFTVPWVGLGILQTADARDSYYAEQNQARRVRTYFEQRGIVNPALLVDSGHYFVYKPFFPNLYNPNYLEPGDATDQYQGLILCYAGSRAFSRAQLPWEPALGASKWRLIDSGEDVVRVALFGHPLMRRNWTWMCDVYARQ